MSQQIRRFSKSHIVQKLAVVGLMQISFLQASYATHFIDHPYYSYSGQLEMAVGQIGCLDLEKTGASWLGSAVHIGKGFILAADHAKFDQCSDRSMVFIPRRGPNKDIKILLKMIDCTAVVDACLLSIVDPYFIPSANVDLSANAPPLLRNVMAIGFPQESTLEITASMGQIVWGPITISIVNNPSFEVWGNTITGAKGSSNSPIVLEEDPSLMVLHFNAAEPKESDAPDHPYLTTQAEAIRLMQEKGISTFNYGVEARRIADWIYSLPKIRGNFSYQNIFSRSNRRFVAQRPLPNVLYTKSQSFGFRKEYRYSEDLSPEQAEAKLGKQLCRKIKKEGSFLGGIASLQIDSGINVSVVEFKKIILTSPCAGAE